MKYLSLFSGIGGFELGIQKAYENHHRPDIRDGAKDISSGISDIEKRTQWPTCVGYSEIDQYATQIYQRHFPDHKNYGDITTINASELPDFDLICGGFPCQAFSIAGKRRGFDDTRGTLFFEIARIIQAKQPRLLLLENVKGLLSHDKGATFTTIIATLDELGYDLQWQVLNSKNHGVPQNRERVFIVGHLRGTPRPQVFPFSNSNETIGGAGVTSTAIDANYGKGIDNHGARTGIARLNNPRHSSDRVYAADGISPAISTMQGGGRQPFVLDPQGRKDKINVPQEQSPTLRANSHGNQPVVFVPEATKQGYAEATIGDSINLSVPNSLTRRGRVGKEVAQTLDTAVQQYTLSDDMQIRRLTPTECERLQGFPDGWTEGVSDTQRYKCLGNAVTTNVIQAIVEKMI